MFFVLKGSFGEVQLGAYGIILQWAEFVFMVRIQHHLCQTQVMKNYEVFLSSKGH